MNKVAVVLATRDGCIEADKKYKETISAIPSPALFVYTLPNIMLGEVCIRHGFKGEQLCMVSDEPDFGELYFWTKDVLENRCMDACLCGWVNATGNDKEVSLFWVTKSGRGPQLSAAVMQQIHDTGR